MNPSIRGLGTALVTPFTPESEVDHNTLRSLVRMQGKCGTDFLVILGTTAETPTLSQQEMQEVIRTVLQANEHHLPIVLGVGGNGTERVVEAMQSLETQGIDALLSVCPYYNKPSQEGLYQHFKRLAQVSPLPIILYNVPARTAVNMLPETTLRLAHECPNIIGIKEASGIVSQADMIIKQRPEGFLVFSGDDAIAYPLVAMGADGVVSVVGNAYPKAFAQMLHLALEGKMSEALAIHHQFKELYPLLFREGNPSGIKALMHLLGLCQEVVRLPLTRVSETLKQEIQQATSSLS